MKLTRQEVFNIIDGEREYQDSRWNEHTTASGGKHSPEEWLVYIQDYLTEAIHIASRQANPEAQEKVMEHIRKIGSMCVAAMEQNGLRPRQK